MCETIIGQIEFITIVRMWLDFGSVSGGGTGPPAPPRGRGRGPMTREEAQRLREEELAGQGHGKDCFIIPQANLDRFLPDGVTVSFHLLTSYHFLHLYFQKGRLQ